MFLGKSQEFESAHPPNPTGFQGAPLVYAKNSRVSQSQLASGTTGGKGSQTPIKWIGCGSCWASTLNLCHYVPGTQMTLVLIGKGLLLEGLIFKIEDKQVPGT